MEKKDNRARNWSCIVYPESAPGNWIELLKEEKISFSVSPVHDNDVNEGTGEFKKAHYHVLLCFEGKKSYEQVKAITDRLNGSIPERVNSTKGLIRYFVHRDNPEKAQYDVNDIKVFGNIDVLGAFKTATSRYDAIKEMRKYCDDNGIIEFADLFDYCALNNDEWFYLLCDNSAYVMGQYLKSRRHSKKQKEE